jgi:hypothetical protein
VEVKAIDIFGRDALDFGDGGIGGDVAFGIRRHDIVMPVTDPGDDPCGFDIGEHRFIIGGPVAARMPVICNSSG